MEAFAAVSLVGNIVQFVSFSGKLISKSAKLYRSRKDILPENADIEMAINHLIILIDRLKDAATSAGDGELQKLCTSCSIVAQELLAVLDKFRMKGGRSIWKSIGKALQNVWSREDIAGLERRVAGLREALNLHLSMNIRYASSD